MTDQSRRFGAGVMVGLALMICWTGAVSGQPAGGAPPDNAGPTHVDTAGCQWQRVDIGEQVAWAEVIGPDGAQICDGAVAATTADTSDPTPAAVLPADPDPAGEAAAAPVIRDAGWRPSSRRPDFPEVGFYVQVGAFAEPDNADRTVGRLMAAGYGVLKQDFPHRRSTLRVLYAGPFMDRAAAKAARKTIRRAGFHDAFIWEQN